MKAAISKSSATKTVPKKAGPKVINSEVTKTVGADGKKAVNRKPADLGSVPDSAGKTLTKYSGASNGVRGDAAKELNNMADQGTKSLGIAALNVARMMGRNTISVQDLQIVCEARGIEFDFSNYENHDEDDMEE